MPIDYNDYPDNWEQIRQDILERAFNQCEFCGVQNYAIGARDKNGKWHDEDSIHHMNSSEGYHLFGEFPTMIKIVLTVARMDHNIDHNEPDNLKALCQRCHLDHDREDNLRKAAETRRRKKEQHQLALFA